VPWEETLAKYLLGLVLLVAAWTNLAISSSLDAAETASGAAPWIISNGNPDAELYVPRDIPVT